MFALPLKGLCFIFLGAKVDTPNAVFLRNQKNLQKKKRSSCGLKPYKDIFSCSLSLIFFLKTFEIGMQGNHAMPSDGDHREQDGESFHRVL